jgi:hypothetical protein
MGSPEVVFETEQVSKVQPGHLKVMGSLMSALDLDLSVIEKRLIDRFKWPARKVHWSSLQYKRFLFMIQQLESIHQKSGALGPKPSLSPSEQIDEFWHMHILDTKKYHEDSIKLFGAYLHHDAGNEAAPSQEHVGGFNRFQEMYRQEFQEELWDFSYGWMDLVARIKGWFSS